MNGLILGMLLLCCCVLHANALEGQPKYDYMVMFMTLNWDEPKFQATIQSMLASSEWAELNAQYGPWTPPAGKK
jgi:hypothetical protein